MLSIIFVLLAAASTETVDVEGHRAQLQVWSDGRGHYIAAESNLEHVYYGDGKVLYETSPFATSSDGSVATATLRDQRYDRQSQTEVTREKDGNLTVVCGKRTTKLTAVGADKAKSVLAAAAFNRGPHNYRPYALARDNKGVYYFVDHGRYPDNERNFRVFVGQRGNMKEQKLSNIVHDSAGDIFATPTGDLRLVVGNPTTSEWVRGDNHTKLLDIPIEDNVPMIYNDLGVYKKVRLGSPCDDL
ncbi:MAG: hypothetical protein ACAI38_01820 [Myxococcota bacterium]